MIATFTTVEEIKMLSPFIQYNTDDQHLEKLLLAVDADVRSILGNNYEQLLQKHKTQTLAQSEKELVELLKLYYARAIERDAAITLTFRIANAGLGVYQPDGYAVQSGSNMIEYFARAAKTARDAVIQKLQQMQLIESCDQNRKLLPFVVA